jgi:hypothetical protein
MQKVELKGADLFGGDLVGGALVEAGESFHGADVTFDGVRGVVAHLDVLDEALAQGCHGLVLSRTRGEKDEGKVPEKG